MRFVIKNLLASTATKQQEAAALEAQQAELRRAGAAAAIVVQQSEALLQLSAALHDAHRDPGPSTPGLNCGGGPEVGTVAPPGAQPEPHTAPPPPPSAQPAPPPAPPAPQCAQVVPPELLRLAPLPMWWPCSARQLGAARAVTTAEQLRQSSLDMIHTAGTLLM